MNLPGGGELLELPLS